MPDASINNRVIKDNVKVIHICYLQAMTEGPNRDQTSRLVLFITLWLSLFVLSVKVSAAWATQSLSLMGESLFTLLICFNTLINLLMITTYDNSPDLSVYGHGKRETVITFVLIAFFGFAGGNLCLLSSQQLLTLIQGGTLTIPVRLSLPLIQLLGAVLAMSLGWSCLMIYQAKVVRSPTLRFQAAQMLQDVGLTILVLGGLWGVSRGFLWLDPLLSSVLVLFAGANCWQVINWQLPLLVKQTPIDPEAIANIAHQVGGVTRCDQIQCRGVVGRFMYVEMHLVVHPEFSGVISLIAERIQGGIQERYGPVQAIFHIDDDLTESIRWNGSNRNQQINGKDEADGE
ncbi:MAG: cation transporter [Moorea sp. SIO3I6]|nr:cation transporter [Moorena sp. SIO3I8]NEO22065.1 cation transporter [Moorena sp. SIO4A5]NEP24468.1 cation transporter [Moorena sp. SIO3I6]NEQ61767.1 cation transporter [Moorena sp. SIO4A1]